MATAAARRITSGEHDAARAGPHLAGGGRGRGGRERGLGGHSAAPWRVPWAVLWALLASAGLVRSRSASRAASRRYVPSVGGPAAVCDVVEVPGGGAQSVGVGGQGAARFGGGLVGGAAGAGVEEGAFLQGADDGAHAFLDGLVPVALGGVRLGGGAVFGGAAGAVVEERGGGGRGAARGAEAPPQGAEDGQYGQDDDDEAECAARGRGGGGAEQLVDPVPEGVHGALGPDWGRSRGTCRLDSSRRAASRAGSRGRVTGGSSRRAQRRTTFGGRGSGCQLETPPARLTASAPRGGARGVAVALEAGGAGQFEVEGLAADALVDVEEHGDARA